MLLYLIPKTFGTVENRVDVDMREVEVCISETVPKGFFLMPIYLSYVTF